MKNVKQKSGEKRLLIITITIIAAVIVFTVIIEPLIKQRNRNMQTLGQLRLKLTKMNGDLLVRDRVANIYSQVEPLISESGTEHQQISLFTRQLDQMYSNLGVKINSVKILPVTDETFYRKLTIKIEMSGKVGNLIKFIALLESCPEPLKIEQFSFKAIEFADKIQATFLITKVVTKLKT